MKRGNFPNSSEPSVRILLVGQHLYQVSLRNIYGYLKTVLLDRCKKVNAQYRHFEKSYFVTSDKLLQLKREFEDVLQTQSSDPQIKFKIEDFPNANIKRLMKQDHKGEDKDKTRNRVVFIDHLSENRYFYAKKKIEQIFLQNESNKSQNQHKILLIVTTEVNKKLWTSVILKNNKDQTKVSDPFSRKQLFETLQLTYSELTNKKQLISQGQQNKVYLITYDNLKFLEGSWFLSEMKRVTTLITDDAEFLVSGQSEIATLQNKKRNFQAFQLLLKNYNLQRQMIVFFSKFPEPYDLIKLLILLRPKNFTGIRFSTSINSFFNESKFTPEERRMFEEFISWYRKRYRTENKCFKQIYFLLNNLAVKRLDDSTFKRTSNLLPSMELSLLISQKYMITLVESSSDLVEKFRIMDKRYKKLCPSINFKQILQSIHDKEKSESNKFQITTKFDDHVVNKHSKSYLAQARQVMLSSKIELILRKLFFVINGQKQRVAIIVQDQKLQKRLKKYFKQTQIQYIDYTLIRQTQHQSNFNPQQIFPNNNNTFHHYNSNPLIQVCIINISKVYKQYSALSKVKKQKQQDQYENQYEAESLNTNYELNSHVQIYVPKITTASSIHFIDSFWYEFCFQKEVLLSEIFSVEMSYVDEIKQQGHLSTFKEVLKRPQILQNYFVFEGSHQKMMLEKYLHRKEEIHSFKTEPSQGESQLLMNFVNNMISVEKEKFEKLDCQVIQYLDIDDEYDKIEQEAKQLKNSKSEKSLEEKVFLPKFTKPNNKSFRELIEEKLLTKNIDEILEESCEDYQKQEENATKNQFQQQKPIQDHKNQLNSPQAPLSPTQQHQVKLTNKYLQTYNPPEQPKISNLFNNDIFDCLIPEIQLQTVKLQPHHLQDSSNPELILNSSVTYNQENQKSEQEKDLFDQLIGENYDEVVEGGKLDCGETRRWDEKLKEPQQEEDEVETQTQTEEDKASVLFKNFGYEAYHKKEEDSQTKPKNRQKKILSKFKPIHHSNHPITRNQDSIEIIIPKNQVVPLTNQIIDLQTMNFTKPKRTQRYSKSNNLKQKINQKMNKLTFYEAPKEKRICNKKIYEEAISKSKQLWEKKLRKEKETLILGTRKFQLALRANPGWKGNLTEEEIEGLREKGIEI